MNELLPYEEELSKQLNDLPLPDENVSWEDIKRRLDQENDDGVIIPPAQRGCLGYSLLLILLAVVIWLIVRSDKWSWNKNQKNIVSSEKVRTNKKDDIAINSKNKDSQKNPKQPESLVTPGKYIDSVADNTKEHLLIKDLLKSNNKKDPKQKIFRQRDASINEYAKTRNKSRSKPLQERITDNYTKRNKNIQKINKKIAGSLISEISGDKQNLDSSKNYEKNITEGRVSITINDHINIDSITKKTTDSNAIKKKVKDVDFPGKIVKQDSIVKKLIYFAVGVALHQQLPVNGQKLVPYNSLGRKGTLADYIPSLYFRMYKDQKWFLQSEFRYGAPQYTKEILYEQKKVVDTFTNSTLSISNRLKKTYYHQLPVSFNYFVLPHLSIGLGFVWNKFSSAISEQEIRLTNNVTQIDSFQIKSIFNSKKADSNFVKSYFQALVETQYQWKRWSFGARYSFGLQPYIRFQLPGGELREEKNSSLQIFFRYNLWESGGK